MSASGVVFDTARKLSRIGTGAGRAFSEGYKAATGSLDEPGVDVSPHPFGPGAVVETTSGIARVVANMIGARRDQANAREARLLKQRQAAKDELSIQDLTQKVAAGRTAPRTIAGQQFNLTDEQAATLHERESGRGNTTASGASTNPPGVPKTYMPFNREQADQIGVAGAIDDPKDPETVWVDPRSSAQSGAFARSQTVDQRVKDARKANDQRIRDLQKQRLEAQSKVAELKALDDQFETQAKGEGEVNRRHMQSVIDQNLQWVTRVWGADEKGKRLPHDKFLQKRTAAAAALGLSPVLEDGEPVKIQNESGDEMVKYDTSPKTLAALTDKAYARGYARASDAVKAKRAAIRAQLQQKAGLVDLTDRELQALRPGFQTGEGDILDQPADEPEDAKSGYKDPADAVKSWDNEDDENDD